MSVRNNPFIVDGPVRPDSPVYIERYTDEMLKDLCRKGKFAHVGAPRSMGKTSLMLRTADWLRGQGARCVFIDTHISMPAPTSDDEWCEMFVEQLTDQLRLGFDGRGWWRERQDIRSTDRLLGLLEEIALEASWQTVIFIDEVEAMELIGFKNSFLRFLRKVQEKRTRNPSLQRISVTLLSSTPLDFGRIEDKYLSDVIFSFTLDDFSLKEAELFATAFGTGMFPKEIIREMFQWTNGHPYLTQRACSVIYEALPSAAFDTSELIRNYFLNQNDPHLDYIRRSLTNRFYPASLLTQYLYILRGISPSSLEVSALNYMVEIGLLKPGTPVEIRNRVYSEVFNEEWVENQLREKKSEDLFDGEDLSQRPGFKVEGRYGLERLIGRGAAGDVYLTQDSILGRSIALRLIPARRLFTGNSSEVETLDDFDKSLRAVVRISRHPNVVTILDFGFSKDEYFYIVMEYVTGLNLSQFLERFGPVSIEQALHITNQIVSAIDAAHQQDILHGDLNPSRIFVISPPGTVDNQFLLKVGDFGIARLMNKRPFRRPHQPPSEGEVGDPVYMAPEQLVGEGPWDHRADIYALGMIVYQLFGGEVPKFENLSSILDIKLEKRFASLRKLREGIPQVAEQVIMSALEVDPNGRPSSAREWFDHVSAAFQSAQTNAETTQPHATGDFEIPIVLHSQFNEGDRETTIIHHATYRLRETLFGGMRLIQYARTDLRGGVFVSVIRQSYTSSEFLRTYREARRFTLKAFVYIKREDTNPPEDPDVLSSSAFEDFQKEMLADGAARFFDTADELGELFSADLSEWLSKQFLPEALKQARQSSPEVITELLGAIKDPEALDQNLLDEVRRQQVESTGRYWFYLSCALEDWHDDDVQRFFQRLNNEVRAIAGASEFYVGSLRPASSEVTTTALREEWSPETLAALQNSRVLMPLYTPDYFKSEVCGKVWEFFQSRIVAENTPAPAPIILPVLWSPNDELPHPLPDAVGHIQYTDEKGRVGRTYSSRGLRDLRQRDHEKYLEFIRYLAQRVVDVATSYPVPPLPEPPAYAQLKNAFAEATDEQTVETSHPPRMKRWIAVAGSTTRDLSDEIRSTSIEIGREIARRGYGLVSGGRYGVESYVYQGFSEELADDNRVNASLRIVHSPVREPVFSAGRTILAMGTQSDREEIVNQADVIVLVAGGRLANDIYSIAKSDRKPVFPVQPTGTTAEDTYRSTGTSLTIPPNINPRDFAKLTRLVETEADARRMSRTLLDMIDSLWLSPTTPRTHEEALSSIVFLEGSPVDPAADAIVNLVGLDPTNYGEVGEDLLKLLGRRLHEQLATQGPLTTGEVLVTRTEPLLIAPYIIHVCSETERGVQTIDSSAEAVKGALRRAELLGLKTITFPSIGTDTASLNAEALAQSVLGAIVDHLRQGSQLQTVLFAFKKPADYEAYFEAFLKIGGKPSYGVLLPCFSKIALSALDIAESTRKHFGRNRVSSSLLLWGLYQDSDSATRELLQSSYTDAEIDVAFRERLGITDESLWRGIMPASPYTIGFASFTPHCDEAFVKAKELAGTAQISERHLLAALLSVSEAHGTKWLSELMGRSASELYDIVAVHGDEAGKSIADEIASQQVVRVETTAWALNLSPPQLNGQDANEIRVGERVTFTISLNAVVPGAEISKNTLRIPANSLELTGFIRAPGCQLPLEIPFTIKTIDGLPETKTFSFDLNPLLSGSRTVEIELYPGGHVWNLGPAITTRTFQVASPVVLPDIKELIDRRQIPHPQPDVMLYVALQETPTHQQTQIYLTCAALELDREPLDPPLQLDESDIAEVRRFAIESAVKANGLSPADGLAVMRSVGAELFDRLINKEFEAYFHEINALAADANRTLSWLVISDEHAILPWELVCYYGSDDHTILYDDFLGDKFQIAHWVGQRGLRLMNTVPMGDLDLIHYNQRSDTIPVWTKVLDPERVSVESDAGQLSLLKENSYCFGLHLLRYAQEQQTKQIVGIAREENGKGKTDGEAITGDQKLDLTLRRPTVGLSFVSELPASALGASGCDTHLESSWLIPFMQAGASALFGPRWPVSVEVDQVFVKEFYDAMRHGETLGAAFFRARARVRSAFPQRTDWLAYTYFGHPHAEPYVVQPAQGFTLFEAVESPKDDLFVAGGTYRFRASYRTEAPAWYDGRLQIQHGSIATQDLSVMVLPLTGVQPLYCTLEPVAEGNELQGMISLTMPKVEANATANLPVMVRFQRATEELRTMMLNLQVKGGL